ncbi:hypothetical protein AB0A70_06570 [Streptomyces morookaense]|uniref:hypothetical protein n=1 Tax=Streptomyces morookaense TaxID=1970 RepID=UPI0034011AE8
MTQQATEVRDDIARLVAQAAPGTVIVLPWGTPFDGHGALARLTVRGYGAHRRAEGPFTGPVALPPSPFPAQPRNVVAEGDVSMTAVTEAEFCDRSPLSFALGIRLPYCRQEVAYKRRGARPVWLHGLDGTAQGGHSWACVMFRDDTAEALVWQGGPRRLWDEAEEAYAWWVRQGEPRHDRFGLTITRTGHSVWLDSPGNVVGPLVR